MADIQQLIEGASDAFVQLQQNLDLDNYDRLTRFVPLWQLMRTVAPQLADSLIPSGSSAHEMSVGIDFQFRRSGGNQFAVEVSILNLGYSTKFEQARFGRCHIQIEFRKSDYLERRPADGQSNA